MVSETGIPSQFSEMAMLTPADYWADVAIALRWRDGVCPLCGSSPAMRAGPDRTANRRSREAYNLYMRDYMRRRRAKGKG